MKFSGHRPRDVAMRLPGAVRNRRAGLTFTFCERGRLPAAKVWLGILLLGSAGCAETETVEPSVPESAASSVDTAAVRAAIDSLRARYESAVATGDLASMGAMVTQDMIAVGPGGPQWDSLRAASELPWPPGATLDIDPIEVRVLSADWAYELGTSTATYTPPGEATRRTLRDTYIVLFHRTPNGWKLHREVASPALPPGQ